jgi:hypothetical protein
MRDSRDTTVSPKSWKCLSQLCFGRLRECVVTVTARASDAPSAQIGTNMFSDERSTRAYDISIYLAVDSVISYKNQNQHTKARNNTVYYNKV